jgi:hypothetical protein
MKWSQRLRLIFRRTVKIAATAFLVCLLAGTASSQWRTKDPTEGDAPEAEFHMARMIYSTSRRAGSRGIAQPMWAVDYPQAEEHFFAALRRLTNLSVSEDSRHLELTDERLFSHPFLFLQQPAAGYWNPTDEDIKCLREYLARGGFMLVDDFHGDGEFEYFKEVMEVVLPDREIVEIPDSDSLMHVFFNLDERQQIPGERHLSYGFGPPRMAGPPHWRGIYDDDGRLMVGINHNMDMGDAWEHADDPNYPGPMTANAYQLGLNYVIYVMTH